MKKISILLFLFCISLVFAYAANSQNPNSSSHYIDNGNRSITDTQTGLAWLKCNVDSKAANCSDNKQLQYVPVGVAGESPSDLSCYNDDSGTSRCANGVLCNDGTFVTVDWRSDFMQYKDCLLYTSDAADE